MHWIAHRTEHEEQSILAHLEGTRVYAGQFAAPFGAQADAEYAAMLHDIGKYTAHFQKRIRDPDRVPPHDHATAGAKEARFSPAGFAIAGHHGGLPDGGTPIDKEGATLVARLKKDVDDYSAWQAEVPEHLPLSVPPDFLKNADQFTKAFYTRMLYSCLVDADYLDTEDFMVGKKPRGQYDTIPQLYERLERHLENWAVEDTPLNQIRSEIQKNCAQAAEQQQGLFTLTVPTGGGKTLSSLLFALKHAKIHGQPRVIYIIPYTSIVDQTAEVFGRVLGQDQVLEHHSGAEYLAPFDGEENMHHLATENWDAPIIVTTAVQFFESLYANKSSHCRKLHNIVNAVLIFDEAQTLPLPYLKPCVAAIAQLVKHYRASAVLCTATQPELEPLFAECNLPCKEIIPAPKALYHALKRTTICDIGVQEWSDLGACLEQQQQVLCIVNRRKTAQEIYRALPAEGSYCLTTLLCPAHRKALLAEIRQRLKAGLPCRVVSTSLVEAGVDLDFRTVYREVAGLDSILQAAGRCNREGRYDASESTVFVFRAPEGVPHALRQKADCYTASTRTQQDVALPQAVRAYFTQWRAQAGRASQDKLGVLDAFTRGCHGNFFPFATIASQFHLIDSPTKTIYIPVDEGQSLVEQLQRGEVNRDLFRKLGQYAVSVYPDHFARLHDTGQLTILPSGDAILAYPELYQSDTGLPIEIEEAGSFFI